MTQNKQVTVTNAQLIAGDRVQDGSVVADAQLQSTGQVKVVWSTGHTTFVNGSLKRKVRR